MNRASIGMVAALAVAFLVAGCKPADDEFAPAVLPKTYAFQGKLDPKYVGTWSSADGISRMDIVKDGSLKIVSTVRSVAGTGVSHISGHWLVDGGSLMFQYVVGTQPATVLKYTATLAGSTLTLKQDGGRAKTVYHRK